MPSFKVPCPSCEAAVLIKNPNLVGTKVECPKCKYRFKVEEPAANAAATGEAAKPDAKAAKADAKDKKAATPGKNKKMVKILIGVGAVVLLCVVGALVLGGGDDKKKTNGQTGPVGPVNPNNNQNPNPDDPDKKKDGTNVDPGPPPVPASTKNATHLLPGQAVAVYRFNIDRARQTPIYETLSSPQVEKMFTESMGFTLADVETYIHCFSGDKREPFGVIKLKNPAKPEDTTKQILLAKAQPLLPKPAAVKAYKLYTVRSNPFVTALSNALSKSSLLGDVIHSTPAATDEKPKPMGVCVYDTQHVLIGDYALLQRFLGELNAEGYPPFKTELIAASVSPPPPPGEPPPPPKDPKLQDPKQPDPKKIDPKKVDPKQPDPKAVDPKKTDPKQPEKPLTSVDTYRTIEFPLKKALDDMEADRLLVPVIVYAEKFDAQQFNPKLLKKEYHFLASTLDPIAERTRYLSMNVMAFTQRQLTANVRFTLGSASDSRMLAKDHLGPALERLAEYLKLFLETPVEFRDYTHGGNTTAPDSGIPPPFPGPGPFPGPFPMPPLPGLPMPGMPGGNPGTPALPPPPPPMPGMPGTPALPPPVPPMFPMPPGGMPPGTDPEPKTPAATLAHLDLGMIDHQLLVAIDLHWPEATYRTKLAPRMVSLANQIKGKMAIFSQDFSWHAVAGVGPKAAEGLKGFPRGTVDRGSNVNRFGLPYPPVQRVSFFYDLLPYMGRGQLQMTISPKLAWYDEKNLPAPGLDRAGAWVPELLVPYYPQSAWRATSPLAPDHVLGATNYVAIAGVGRDIPRANPNDPEAKKLVGITGYGWGSKVEEITDGLSNTIYMMQTPPGLQQPWIAGGGATIRGLDANKPMAAFAYDHPDGDSTKSGTYALMADGSVRWIPANIDPKVIKAMATRAGGESLADIDKHTTKVEAPKVEIPAELKTDPKPEDPKPADPKGTDPKPADKKEPGAKPEVAPAPKEK